VSRMTDRLAPREPCIAAQDVSENQSGWQLLPLMDFDRPRSSCGEHSTSAGAAEHVTRANPDRNRPLARAQFWEVQMGDAKDLEAPVNSKSRRLRLDAPRSSRRGTTAQQWGRQPRRSGPRTVEVGDDGLQRRETMSWSYSCPHCSAGLNPDETIVLVGELGDQRILVGLHPEPGNYQALDLLREI
jgi:hypothetical protein